MGYTNAYNVYKETSVKTASQGKLIIMLYEGAIRHLSDAADFISDDGKIAAKNIEAFSKSITKAQEIITELTLSLNTEAGGDIAKNLMSLYMFFNSELMSANISKDKKKILNVKKMMSDLLGAWNVAVDSTAPVGSPIVRQNIDIDG